MSQPPFFPKEEYQTRLQNIQQRTAERDLDACLVSAPENIYYLTGLSHQGFFAYHGLIVPRDGGLHLITRAMERVTVENQLDGVNFVGHADSADPAQVTCQTLAQAGLGAARLGLEKNTLFLPSRIADEIQAALPQVQWHDISGLIDELRLVKSSCELDYMRQAAAVTDAMTQAALDIARVGVSEQEIAAEVQGDYFVSDTALLTETGCEVLTTLSQHIHIV